MSRLFKVVLIVSVLGLCAWSAVKPTVVMTQRVIDLGDVRQGELATRVIDISNSGFLPLRLDEVTATCACTGIATSGSAIGHARSGQVQITLDSSLLSGPVRKTIAVLTNDMFRKRIEIQVVGTVRKEFSLEAPGLLALDGSFNGHRTAQARIRILMPGVNITSVRTSVAGIDVSLERTAEGDWIVNAVEKSARRTTLFGVAIVQTSSRLMPELRIPIVVPSL